MKRLVAIVAILLAGATEAIACCAEKDYRLFPIGELDKKVVFIEFNLYRNCKQGSGGEPGNEFWTTGTVRIVTSAGDSLTHVTTLDTLNIQECTCTYKNFYADTEYEAQLAVSYLKALRFAKRAKGFHLAKPMHITFNDTLNTQVVEVETDSTFALTLRYRDLPTINLGMEEIISCYPDKVAEIRTYQTASFEVTVLRLRCRLLDEQAIQHNQENFKRIATAFWKEQAQWHGIAKDYWVIHSSVR